VARIKCGNVGVINQASIMAAEAVKISAEIETARLSRARRGIRLKNLRAVVPAF